MLSPNTRITGAGRPAARSAPAGSKSHKKDRIPMTRDIVLRAERATKQVNSPEGPLTIVREVSCEIRARESVAIIGPSGAGKSTLLALFSVLDLPSSGRVWLAREDLSALDEDGRARLRAARVGFVFQSFHLVPALTALENVM